jgi:hypothetical protein
MILFLVPAWALGLVVISNIAEERPQWYALVAVILAISNTMIGFLGLGVLAAILVGWPGSMVEIHPGVVIILLVTALVGGLGLIPNVRRRLASVLPLRPESPVHLVALTLSLYLISWNMVNLFLVGGVEGLQDNAPTVPVGLFTLQGAGLVAFAFVGVGLFVRRSWEQVVDRMGMRQWYWYSPIIAAATVAVLVGINFTASVIWMLVDPEQAEAIGRISEVMLGDFDSFGTVFLLAVLSSVSEELLFRGAVQPRLGIVFTSVLFAFTHLQYAISPATLVVFIIGLMLGMLRRYFGTWTAILTHFGYNFGLLLLGLAADKFIETLG